jgi:diguanylate cyclase (GGDEF)-like protein
MRYTQRLILIVSFLVQISVAVGLTSWFSLQRKERAISEVSQRLHNDLTEQFQIRLFNFLAVSEITNQLLLNKIKSQDSQHIDTASIEQLILENLLIFSATDAIDTISYGNERGEYIGAGRMPDGTLVLKIKKGEDLYIYSLDKSLNRKQLLSIRLNYDPRKRPWYQTAVANKKRSWSPIYLSFSNYEQALALAEPIDKRNGQLFGVIGTELIIKDVNNFLDELQIGKTGRTFILERTGEVVAASGTKKRPVDEDSKEYVRLLLQNFNLILPKQVNLKNIQKTKILTISVNGETKYIQISTIKDNRELDWLLLTEFSRQEFKDLDRYYFEQLIRDLLIVFIVATIFAIASNNFVIKPFLQLIELKRDRLTGLPSRTVFIKKIERAIAQHKTVAVILIDCDRFKRINSSYSHQVGDTLLVEVAKRLRTCLDSSDALARLITDEFAFLSLKIKDENSAIDLVNRIVKALSPEFLVSNKKIFLSSRMGIAINKLPSCEPEHLLRNADTAMLKAKQIGGSCYQIFDETMRLKTLAFLELENDLKTALQNQEFLIYYQPIVELQTGKISGLEALLRWRHPVKGFISPTTFIPIAEETGIILDLGIWIFQEACKQLKSWNCSITISVNLSARQLEQPDLLEKIDEISTKTEVDTSYLKIELTESVFTGNYESVKKILEQFQARKIRVSLDDFGTGYSCLSYLHQLPVNTLKIDRAFVNRETLEIAETIIVLAHNLGMDVIAEGVETEEQRSQLQALGCEYGQGYLFAKPMNNSELENLLVNGDFFSDQ